MDFHGFSWIFMDFHGIPWVNPLFLWPSSSVQSSLCYAHPFEKASEDSDRPVAPEGSGGLTRGRKPQWSHTLLWKNMILLKEFEHPSAFFFGIMIWYNLNINPKIPQMMSSYEFIILGLPQCFDHLWSVSFCFCLSLSLCDVTCTSMSWLVLFD